MAELMAIINLTPDSFYAPSRVASADVDAFLARVRSFAAAGASIIDLGAVSTRPGAVLPSLEEEWERLEPALEVLAELRSQGGASEETKTWEKPPQRLHPNRSAEAGNETDSFVPADAVCPASGSETAAAVPEERIRVSIDTFRAEIVRRAYGVIGDFIVNDISAGEDDPEMLPTVGRMGLEYVAMHKRGAPGTMDSLCDYPDGVVAELIRYFADFERRAAAAGVERWILDPGLGFAKTPEQNWEVLRRLPELQRFGRPILIGAADKRFTREVPPDLAARYSEGLAVHGSVSAASAAGSSAAPAVSASAAPVAPASSDAPAAPVSVPNAASPTAFGTAVAHRMALAGGAAILRVHNIPK